MATPMDMVRGALAAGQEDGDAGIDWIKRNHRCTMRHSVFGKLKSLIQKKGPPVEKVQITADRVTQPTDRQVIADAVLQTEDKVYLAQELKRLLSRYKPETIIDMVVIVHAIS